MGAGAATRRARRGLTGRGEAVAADCGLPGEAAPPDGAVARRHPGSRRWLMLAACAAGCVAAAAALLMIYLRVSLTAPTSSDAANNAFQAWSMLHGNLVLHGWYIGDANFYFFELPVNALTEVLFGLGNLAAHVASALVYLIVTVLAVALAMGDSRGVARLARGAVVLSVLAAPLLDNSRHYVLEQPDHIGTSAFILAVVLLIDRRPGHWVTAPLVCLLLAAGQFSDLTVRYIAVPAVVLVCGVRALAARRLRSPDGKLVVAAVISVPLAMAFATLLTHLGGFWAAAPKTRFSAPGQWPHRAAIAWGAIRLLFSAVDARHVRYGVLGVAFGWACLLAVVAGLLAVVAVLALAAWATARRRPGPAGDLVGRAGQLLAVVIAANLGAFVTSAIVHPVMAHELLPVLPCGTVLAARALVPVRVPRLAAAPVAAAAALIVVLPLGSAATVPPYPASPAASLTAWLAAHGLHYGLGAYGVSSDATLQSGGSVEIRAVKLLRAGRRRGMVGRPGYENDMTWYDPARHDATFAIARPKTIPGAAFERTFGKPVAFYRVGEWGVLVYRYNLLSRFASLPPGA